MQDKSTSRSKVVRYRLRSLIIAVALAAIALAIARPLFDWLDSIPLSQAVSQFNDRIATGTRVDGDPLTEETVFAAVESCVSRGNAPEHMAATVQHVLDSRRLPRSSFLDHEVCYKGSTPGNPPIECFDVSLVFTHKSEGSFKLHVCEIENGFLLDQ